MADALGKVLSAGLTTADLARALDVSQRTVQRWIGHLNTPTRDKEARLLELAAVLQRANGTLPGGPADTALWLRAPADQLDWQVPLDVISQGRFRQVIAALPGRIVSIPLAAAGVDPASVPDGTTASRCTACGENRLHYPGDLTDEWKHHFDYCGDKDPEATR